MKITPVQGPHVMNPIHKGSYDSQQSQDARSRAIAKLSGASQAAPAQSGTPPMDATTIQQAQSSGGQPHLNEAPQVSEAPAAAPAPAAEPKTDDSMSQHYAILARKEKALRAKAYAQEQAYLAKEKAMKEQEDAWKAKDAQYQSQYIPRDRLSQDPMAVLNEAGISYEKLTEMLLNPQQASSNAEFMRYQQKMDGELKAIREQNEQFRKSQEEAQANQYKQALVQIQRDVQREVEANPAFEMIKETGSTKDVVDLIERVYKRDGYVMDNEEACRLVEEDLMLEAEKIFKINKLKSKFQQAASAPAPVAKSGTQSQQQPQGMKTLTNSVASSGKMSARDRAIARMKGQL
jgi:hypothetical protein